MSFKFTTKHPIYSICRLVRRYRSVNPQSVCVTCWEPLLISFLTDEAAMWFCYQHSGYCFTHHGIKNNMIGHTKLTPSQLFGQTLPAPKWTTLIQNEWDNLCYLHNNPIWIHLTPYNMLCVCCCFFSLLTHLLDMTPGAWLSPWFNLRFWKDRDLTSTNLQSDCYTADI